MEIPSSSSPSSSPNSSSNNNGVGVVGASLPPTVPPKSSTIPPPSAAAAAAAQTNPYPTTFVQADTHSFKQMVQLLTGSAETAAAKRHPSSLNTPKISHSTPPPALNYRAKKPAFKLYERRPSMKNLKMISPSAAAGSTMMSQNYSPSSAAAAARCPLSPSILDFPSLALSPVTPLIPDPFHRPSPPNPNPNPNPNSSEAEERAIAEKGFYLHPSPRPAAPRDADPPRLLPLFPLTSPRDSSSSSSSSTSSSTSSSA